MAPISSRPQWVKMLSYIDHLFEYRHRYWICTYRWGQQWEGTRTVGRGAQPKITWPEITSQTPETVHQSWAERGNPHSGGPYNGTILPRWWYWELCADDYEYGKLNATHTVSFTYLTKLLWLWHSIVLMIIEFEKIFTNVFHHTIYMFKLLYDFDVLSVNWSGLKYCFRVFFIIW